MIAATSLRFGLLATLLTTTLAVNVPSKRSHDGKAGYFGIVFQDKDEQVNAILSNGRSSTNFTLLNGGNPILKSNVGTENIRDPFLVESNSVNYVIATDNSLKKHFGDDGVKGGSRHITVWKSKGSSLTQWESPFLSNELVNSTFGSVSAPEAHWQEDKKAWLVFFSTVFFPKGDKSIKPPPASIWATYTTDFKSFTDLFQYYDTPLGGVTDMTIAPLNEDGKCFIRFFRDDEEGKLQVRGQVTKEGLFGKWTDIGGAKHFINSNGLNGGPLIFTDIDHPTKWNIWIDDFAVGYEPFTSDDIAKGDYKKVDTPEFLKGIKQGSVIQVSQKQYDEIKSAKW